MEVLRSASLLLALLNPFLVIIYLVDLVRRLDRATFRAVLLRGGAIAAAVFCVFALLGDFVFSDVVQARFASFQIFGGVVFLLIGLQFVFRGPGAMEILRGESAHLGGAIAMPVFIGPGTISASVVIGRRLEPLAACGAVLAAVAVTVSIVLLLKVLHDGVRSKHEPLIERYVEIVGRITALYVGTVSVEMIMQGLGAWTDVFRAPS